MHGIVHLILHHLEEEACRWCIAIVINSCSVDIRQFLIETLLRKTLVQTIRASHRDYSNN